MHWFGGSIAEAVNLSKQKNAIFVVFIEGDNDLSSEMATTIEDTAVVKRLSNEANFLAIKLKSGTTDYTHFAQIYQFVPVPSLFFIGRNGTPLEVVCAGVQPANLATRIDRILEEHYKEKSSVQPSSSTQDIKQQTASLLQAEAEPETTPLQDPDSSEPAAKIAKTARSEAPSGQQYEVVCEGDVCVRRPADQPGPSQPPACQPILPTEPAQPDVSMDDKLERAKELIEAKNREKADKDKELEKQKEIERRNTGQGVAELKRWQADQEMKQLQEERKREKMENNMARQRILEQIAQDRAERRARDFAPPPAQHVAPPTTPAAALAGDAVRARLQFKLPDGGSHSAQFEADAKLADVTRYIADNLQLSASQITLWTAFPRRELTDGDATLLQLQLAPSAALLVQTRCSAPPAERNVKVTSLIAFLTQLFSSLILTPSQQLYTWLRMRLFPPVAPPRGPPSPPRASPPPPSAQGAVRKRTNIHRLPGDRSGDEDNNTWNGNSTQQM